MVIIDEAQLREKNKMPAKCTSPLGLCIEARWPCLDTHRRLPQWATVAQHGIR